MKKLIIILSFLSFSGCLSTASFPPLIFQGNPAPLKPGDIIDTRSGEIISFEVLLGRLSGARVVYVGETHTSLEDHRIQLQVLEGLYHRNPDTALALEMFPRQVQPVLDRFVRERIPEEEFIREVNWEEVWGYPFQLYRPLLVFARDRGLPVIGLNAPRAVVNKIAREGLPSLKGDERKLVAEIFLTDDPKHREMLRQEFERHARGNIKDFDSFYEAQLAWDETMAETLVRTLQARAVHGQVLVLVGRGHILDGVGMPQAALKRMPHTYKTVVPVSVDYPLRTLTPGLADFLWITPPFKETHPPRLGIQVKPLPENGGLEVLEVTPGGPAAKAGFQKGDVIVQAAGEAVRTVENLHRLFSGRPEKIRFLLRRSDREVTVEVRWKNPPD